MISQVICVNMTARCSIYQSSARFHCRHDSTVGTIRPYKSDMIFLNKIQEVWKCLFIFSILVMATLISATWKFDFAKSPNKEKATQDLQLSDSVVWVIIVLW